ncbi:Ff.00g029720.m01.CDS01 [Fusarium sp. VM40]|nr:Ff.00g029720.m01.CDS01 [Fusarium sp. VM40]
MTPARGRPAARFWAGDEEMANKKDDDLHVPGHRYSRSGPQWQATPRAPRRSAIGRLIAYLVFVSALFFVAYNLLSSSNSSSGTESKRSAQSGRKQGQDKHDYRGPLKFPELADTLRNIQGTGGSYERNKNVLFAASSINSASALLPMACQMSAQDKNHVHFALMSRNEIPVKELLEINGIDESCKLFFHDARTDYASTSSELRLKLAAIRAFYYIDTFMHPQAIIVDSTHAEETYFLQAARDQIPSTKSALIELPDKPETRLAWISKLDSTALSGWNKVHFDILVQAPAVGTANLQRLLTSLRRADKSALSIPQLTIELPPVIEKPLESFLSNFQWPSKASGQLPQSQMLSLRHRISTRKMDEEESSVRFLESFWPSKPSHNHVLVLAAHTEVSPQFFNYVKYNLLHSLYSHSSVLQDWNENIMGISFHSPSTLLDDTTPLTVPAADTLGEKDGSSPFFWQAPTNDAILFMGDKWVELHGYVSHILEKQQERTETPAFLAKKNTSKKHPAWLEYVLQLSQLRGYVTLYPRPETAATILGAHSDLPTTPEEYLGGGDESDENGKADSATSKFDPASPIDMLATLPREGDLLSLGELPLVSWSGKPTSLQELEASSFELTKQFRQEVGQCPPSVINDEDEFGRPRRNKDASDLFCRGKNKADPEVKGTKETT